MQRHSNPFSKDKDIYSKLINVERVLMGTLAATAIVGTFTPVVFAPNLNSEVKLIQQLLGLFSGACFTAEAYRRKHKEKFYKSIEDASHAIIKEELKGTFTYEQCKNAIESKRELAGYVNGLPEMERARWMQSYGLQGLVELPQIQQAVLDEPRQLVGSRTIPNPEIATIDERVVQAIINPSTRQLLEELAAQYPGYIRIDDEWVDELCESSARQKMGERANHHFSFLGETQSGKSTLAGVFINKIAAMSQGPAYVFGSDPKNYLTAWLCKFSRKFDGFKHSLDHWVTFATKVIDARQEEFKNNRKGEGLGEIFLIQDEVNVVYGEGKGLLGQVPKETAMNLCAMWNYVINFTAAMKIHGIFMGQSPLSAATGFSRPALKNICFLALGKVSNYVLTKMPELLNVKTEISDLFSEVCELLDNEEVRYALVIPTRGNPFVALIPIFDIDAMEQTNDSQDEPQPQKDTADYYQILVEWVKSLGRQPTADELKAAWKHLTTQELNDKGVELLTAKLMEGLNDE